MDKKFEYYLQEIYNKRIKEKFVIVLGSGFHKQAFMGTPDIFNCLTSWCCLLKAIDSKTGCSNNLLLDFEKIILKRTNSQDEKAAYKTEEDLLKNVVIKIKRVQSKVLKRKDINYPIEIFNSNFVSDVISLNFDLIPELLLNNNKKTKVNNIHDYKNKKSIINSTRHRFIKGINFWHPHGDIDKYDSLILGSRKYGLHINKIEKLRKRSKHQNKPDNYQKSWYDALTHNPVIILGADISDMEWDIWNAIVNRERNYGKKENKKIHRYPIFQMRELNNKSLPKSNELWFRSLFDTPLLFNVQWKKLVELLIKNDK
jgi:hypothetical protein